MSDPLTASFTTIVNRACIARPVEVVWGRVGGFFDLGNFLAISCTPLAGDGGIGSTRCINDVAVEPMVGSSRYSYTYAQTAGPMSGCAYHGCVACEATDTDTTELTYTLVYDESKIDPDRRATERVRLAARFADAVTAMQRAAEA